MLRLRALAVLPGLVAGALLTATPASANVTTNETYARDSDSTFAVEGHGWGHGHGMSQWGAQGAASLSRTADDITAFYYPGTAKGSLADSPIRVLLQADTGGDTQVYPATNLAATDLATNARLVLPSGYDRWRAVTDSAGLHLQGLVGSAWRNVAIGGTYVSPGPILFGGSTFVRVLFPDGSSRDYRGGIRSVRVSATTTQTVNVLTMETYLLGVVPRESSSSWKPAALQAQAVAARSYSAYKRAHAPSGQSFDICDTTQCQVYGGAATWSGTTRTSLEPQSTTDAVRATAGVIRTYDGAAIFAEFCSSNGGWSTDGGVAYLKAQRDDWDGAVSNTVHSWTATLTAAQVEARYPAIGTLKRIRVTERDGNGEWGGRVKTVVLEGVDSSGAATSVTTTGAGIYNANSWPARSDGLRSSWWHIAAATSSAIVTQSAAPRLVQSPGVSTGTLTVTLKNTGSTTWSTSGLHLAVASPPGQADPLVGNSTTPGTYTGSAASIAPGETAAFSFALTGDGVSPGLQGRSYRLRNGTGGLFGTTVSWQVQVDAASFAGLSAAPVAMAPSTTDAPGPVFADGRTVVVPRSGSTALTVKVTNKGNVSWPAGTDTPLKLGTSSPHDRQSASAGPTWVSATRPSALSGTAAVAPGGVGSFDLTLNGNDGAVGVTSEEFAPLWEGKAWLAGAVTPLTVVRTDPTSDRLAGTELAPAASLALTTAPVTSTLVVRLRNLGGQPWAVGTERLRASSGTYAGTGWLDATTPPALKGNVTRPGQSQVYPGEVGEWQVPMTAYRKAAGNQSLALQAVSPSGALYGPRFTTRVTASTATFTGSLVRVPGTFSLPASGRVSVTLDVKNTGNTAWPVGGNVRTEAKTSGGSPSYYSSWISRARPGAVRANVSRPGATSVAPGEVARFVLVMAGNGRSPGARSEGFGVLWEGWTRVAGLTATLRYTIV